jgi:hypothetical protein
VADCITEAFVQTGDLISSSGPLCPISFSLSKPHDKLKFVGQLFFQLTSNLMCEFRHECPQACRETPTYIPGTPKGNLSREVAFIASCRLLDRIRDAVKFTIAYWFSLRWHVHLARDFTGGTRPCHFRKLNQYRYCLRSTNASHAFDLPKAKNTTPTEGEWRIVPGWSSSFEMGAVDGPAVTTMNYHFKRRTLTSRSQSVKIVHPKSRLRN